VSFLLRPIDPLRVLLYHTGSLRYSSEIIVGQRESCYAGVFKFLAPKRQIDNSDEKYVFAVHFVSVTDAFIKLFWIIVRTYLVKCM